MHWSPPMTSADPVGEALHLLRMTGTFYCRTEVSGPWGLALPAKADTMRFHVVTQGGCYVQVEGEAPVFLAPGDLVLVPHGRGHQLLETPNADAVTLDHAEREVISESYAILRYGGGGAKTSLLCGGVRFEHPAAEHLLELLPKTIVVRSGESPEKEWMQSTLRLIAEEARAKRPGGETVITRLADVLVVQAIRSWMVTEGAAQGGWLRALQDRQIGAAIALIHREPGREFTIAGLARELGMSRSAFSARFSQLVGEPVMQYVARWRMHLATLRLKREELSLAELAESLGYQSEAAFSRAYKRFSGVSPGTVRRDNGSLSPA